MRKATFIALLVPVLFFAASFAGPLEQTAQADPAARSGHVGSSGGRGGFVGRGGARGHAGGDGRYVGRGDYVGRGGGHRGGGHFSSSIWIGPGWGWGVWDPFFYPWYPYYSYPYYAPPTVVVPREPEEYVMPEPQQAETGYWYYCKDANGYYPYVKRCPGGWLRVVPSQPPPDQDQEE